MQIHRTNNPKTGINSLFGLLSLASVIFTSCTNDALFQEYASFGTEGWHRDSAVVFEVLIEDTNTYFKAITHLRHNPNYPYRNFYMFREIHSETEHIYTDTVNYTLSTIDGKRVGKGVSYVKEISAPVGRAPFRFQQRGIYTFRFTQGMRNDLLPGIQELGFSLEPVEVELDNTLNSIQ